MNRIATSVRGLATILALAALGAAVARAESDPVTLEFAGFQSFVAATDDATLLAAKVPPLSVSDGPKLSQTRYFDGLMHVSGDALVAQSYDRTHPFGDASWRHFDGTAAVFPRYSTLAGRAPGFLWRGYGNGMVDIAPDTTQRRSYREGVESMRRIYAFSSDPERAFTQYGVRGRTGEIRRGMELAASGVLVRWLSFRLAGAARPHLKLWAFYPDPNRRQGPYQWIFAVKDLQAGRTHLTRIRTRFVANGGFEFPQRPSEIVRAHASVQDVEKLRFRDYTHFGPWKRQEPRCGEAER